MVPEFKFETVPKTCGVYIMRDKSGEVFYVGKARDLSKRIRSYFLKSNLGFKNSILVSSVKQVDYVITHSEKEALLLERELIKKYQPRYNVIWRDDKSYPHLKLTLNEAYPRIYLTRKIVQDGSRYFGPYTHVGQVRRLLRRIRKLFPLRVCKHTINDEKIRQKKIKPCLYYYIDQCLGPCTGRVSKQDYMHRVKDLILFLNGNFRALINTWLRKMKLCTKKLEFEKAAFYRDSIKFIQNMFGAVTFREVTKEMLEERIEISKAITELKEKLFLPKLPLKIEAFDVSNIFGNEAVGSMVRFHHGLPEKSGYRRFKIKSVSGIDDYKMISEVVKRRYRRLLKEGQELPDLTIIDGGKGHLSITKKVLDELKVDIPLISIAKKHEKIFSIYSDKEIILPKDSAALHLLQRIRNEAHRFALSYHKLRRKRTIDETK